MENLNRKERAKVLLLVAVMLTALMWIMVLPFLLGIFFGDGWVYLNFITVPGYLALVWWMDRRGRRGDKQ